MEALAVLSLVGNILQFVDFADKIVSGAHKIYKATSGSKEEHDELECLTNDLQNLAANASPPRNPRPLSEEDQIIIDLGRQCSQVSDQLLSKLESLKVKGRYRSMKALYQAFRSEWKKDEIEALQQRIDRIGARISTRVLAQQQSRVLAAVEGIDLRNQQLEAARSTDIAMLKLYLEDQFKKMSPKAQRNGAMPTREELESMSAHAELGIRYNVEQEVLTCLRFEGMEKRHETLREAHAKTFSWIFEESASTTSPRFDEWLKSDSNLYWVSGKPGSGKSTLMKYLYHHQQTRTHLEQWSKGDRLIMTNFFFWSASRTELPKSLEGLLRSMLYQILRESPDLIAYATPPGAWDMYLSERQVSDKLKQNWSSVPELLKSFRRISEHAGSSKQKFCFFIDALDEYENEGKSKPEDIIEVIGVLNTLANAKICVSSRPWNEFERAFGEKNTRKLYIENLTRADIELYVRDSLEQNPDYRELQGEDEDEDEDQESLDLVKDIVDAARGVFLWVHLVVQSLLRGLKNCERRIDLQRRLRTLPTDLKAYFRHIFNHIDEFNQELTAQMFLATLESHQTLSLLSYWFMDEITPENPEYAIKLAVKPLSVAKSNTAFRKMPIRLNDRCKGLLDTQFYDSENYSDNLLSSSALFNWKVDFLHRTVRDFLKTEEMARLLKSWVAPQFDVHFVICQAMLAQIKTAPQSADYFKEGGPVWKLVNNFNYHAEALTNEKTGQTRRSHISKALENTISTHGETISGLDQAAMWFTTVTIS